MYRQSNLIFGDFPVEAAEVTIKSGENLTAGTVIGKITSTGKCVKSLSASSDGSQNVYAILADDCDASAGDKKASAFITGSFNENALTFGTGHTAASTKDAFRALGIILRASVK